jgi:4-hydroxy-tetrahydrodipicolinate synthase
MKTTALKGLGVAMVTPFDDTGKIDINALKKFTSFLINGGVDYLVVLGTTGESPVLSKAEKQLCLNTVIEVNNGKLPIVFGIGGNNTAGVIQDFAKYDLSKVDAILSASPYYNKPSQEGIYQHYKAIASATELPIILYNVPGRTASNVTAETTLRLANDFKNIVAIKEASGYLEQVMEIIADKPADFLVISGDDALTLPLISVGGDGVISVVGNAFPEQFKAMVANALADQMNEARKNHYKVFPIISHLFAEGNPGGIKECLAHIGLMSNNVRLPLVPVSKERRELLIGLTDKIINE